MTMTRILVVDTATIRRQHRAHLFRAASWQVDAARDAWQALDKQAATPYDLLVLDVSRSKGAGLALAWQWRRLALRRNPPILLLTDSGQDNVRNEAFHSGANTLLRHDCEPGELLLVAALLMGRGREVLRGLQGTAAEQRVRERIAALWQNQIALLDRPGAAAATVSAARTVLEHLLSLRLDDGAIDAALTMTRVAGGPQPLQAWARFHAPVNLQRLDPAFERWLASCQAAALS